MTAQSHTNILDAAARGDDDALSALVRLHHDRVYRYGLRVCRDGFDADDAVQEAFIKLATRQDVVADRGALSWLMTVVRNTCIRLLRPFQRRRRALGEQVGEEDLPAAELSADAALERWELVRSVHTAIAELEKPYREVLVLRDLEGLSGEETSAVLGLEIGAMKSRLHRARAMLREKIERRGREVRSPRHGRA
ncbi:MAG: sigma-70 family RNA polymerase sigma factor [Polyangiaceae bacterium]|nr:sigma-70 family RNA polymerase sigma factor [Polyangiaceae bacterium]